MKILFIILDILSWFLGGLILWVIYPLIQKLISLGQHVHDLWK